MNTNEYLDACKKKLKIDSDYALAKHLEISKSAFPKYRHKNGTLDDRVAVKVAETLGIPKGRVLADMQAERAKDETLVKIWKKLAETATACIVVVALGGISASDNAYAQDKRFNDVASDSKRAQKRRFFTTVCRLPTGSAKALF